jgi:signal transduction histidine kinase
VSRPTWLAWVVAAVTAVVTLVSLWLTWLTRATPQPPELVDDVGVLFLLGWLVYAGVGLLLAVRRPRNSVGWLLLGTGLAWELFGLAGAYRLAALAERPEWPGGVWAAWAWAWVWVPALLGIFLLPHLFPDGRLPSPRWRIAVGLLVGGSCVVAAATALRPGPLPDAPLLTNPAGVEALGGVADLLESLGNLAFAVGGTSGFVSVVLRYRRSDGVRRHQLKWFAFAGVVVLTAFTSANVLEAAGVDPSVLGTIRTTPLLLLPLAIGVAVLGYRLYDIDVVISRTIVYGALAVLIGGVYVVVVVGAGTLIGARRQTDMPLSIVATALTAVAFAPARARLQQLADRLVHGRRATPYEALAAFHRFDEPAAEHTEALEEMARMITAAVGAERGEVWVRDGAAIRLAARWPGRGEPTIVPVTRNGDGALRVPGADRAYPVVRGGRLLGALAIRMRRSATLRPVDDRLLADLASAAWLVLANVELVRELRASRQRLIDAQDAERARIERDLHDGAQQRLLELALTLRLARERLPTGAPEDVVHAMDTAQDQLRAALAELREFARGIHPAILTSQGLGAALESLAERSPVPVTVDADGVGRLPPPIEVTAYFVVSEGLANVLKHAYASSASAMVRVVDGWLRVVLTDDGVGGADPSAPGLQGLADRVAALDGHMTIASPEGGGTRVEVSLPCG